MTTERTRMQERASVDRVATMPGPWDLVNVSRALPTYGYDCPLVDADWEVANEAKTTALILASREDLISLANDQIDRWRRWTAWIAALPADTFAREVRP